MDFNDTPEEAAYRQQVREWLTANAPKKREGEPDPLGESSDGLAASKAWQAKKASAGYACITWPK
ncbi:MAG: acyl-CoA dehydrogenase, partial [Phenylobacterium sp.]|nr:acyl-CoA dehydrogenase [Phenylobacterium sp.]